MEDTAVLLATFNGGPFLQQQLDSLQQQTYRDYAIFIRDDGSSDNTCAIISKFAALNDINCSVIQDGKGSLGACQNFNRLLESALSDSRQFRFFAFCDQDDIWHPQKLEITHQHLRALEISSPCVPTLVRSDAQVVNEALELIAASFWQNQGVDAGDTRLKQLILRNTTIGCTAMINRRLAELATPIPAQAIMHDWWITIIAAAVGHIANIYRPLLKYRQHASNALGVGPAGLRRLINREHWATRVFNNDDCSPLLPFAQAYELRERCSTMLDPISAETLARLRDFQRFSHWKRRLTALRTGIFPRDPTRLVGLLLKL